MMNVVLNYIACNYYYLMKKWKKRTFEFGKAPAELNDYLKKLDSTVGRLRNIAASVPESDLEIRVDNKWSVKENIGHLFDLDEIHVQRLDELCKGEDVLSVADDKNLLTESTDHNSEKVRDLLKKLEGSRKVLLERFRAVKDSDLEKTSLHPRLETPMNTVDLAFFISEHDNHHIAKINEVIESLDFDE